MSCLGRPLWRYQIAPLTPTGLGREEERRFHGCDQEVTADKLVTQGLRQMSGSDQYNFKPLVNSSEDQTRHEK